MRYNSVPAAKERPQHVGQGKREELEGNPDAPVFRCFLGTHARRVVMMVKALLNLLAIAGCITGFVASVAAAWACLNWVLGPLDRAAKNRQFPIQFGLADLLCLFVLIQLPVGILHWTLADVLQKESSLSTSCSASLPAWCGGFAGGLCRGRAFMWFGSVAPSLRSLCPLHTSAASA